MFPSESWSDAKFSPNSFCFLPSPIAASCDFVRPSDYPQTISVLLDLYSFISVFWLAIESEIVFADSSGAE